MRLSHGARGLCAFALVTCIACGDDDGAAGAAGVGAMGGIGGASGTGGVGGAAGTSGTGGSSGMGGTGGTGGASGMGGTGGAGGSSGTGGAGGVAGVGPVIEPGDPGAADVRINVRVDLDVRAISPLIYGTNGAPEIATTHQTVIRSGGNRLTAYNWENNASNAGSDYLFQNDGYLSNSDVPGRVVSDFVDEAIANDAAAIVTIPNVDYVSADKNGGGDVRNSGGNYLSTRFQQNRPTKGSAFSTTPDVNDDFVYQDEFVSWLHGEYPNAHVLFSMDNEPDLWSSTHAEVHPDPVTYAELWQRNHDYASAVKAVWPTAEVLGFVSYGFNGYTTLQNAPDANGRDFIEWYLDQAEAAETADGQRVIDYLDLHWYPEARGGGERITDGSSQGAVSARMQAPRSLWDASYREDSWIANDVLNAPIDLLHSLRSKIDAHYPGTKLAFTEWNYGGGDHISGAIAVADVLGIFGREGVDLATYWGLHPDESYAYCGFRAYRNFDGNGASFGDTSIAATSDDIETATAYASIDSANPTRTVILAINKANTEQTAGITIAQSVSYSSASVYRIVAGQANVVASGSINAVATNAFSYTMPAQSVSVIVPMQ